MLISLLTLGAVCAGLLAWSSHGVRLRTSTVVSLAPDRAWQFFVDPNNLARWDRSVKRVEPKTPAPIGPGYAFDTVAPGPEGTQTRSSYRVTGFTPRRGASIDLIGSPQFRRARWHTRLEPVPGGTRIVIEVEFAPRPRYFFLTPVLYLSRDNLTTDMDYLHDEVEAYGRRTRS